MNKLFVAFLVVAAVGLVVEADSSLEKCKAELEYRSSFFETPKEFVKILTELRESDPKNDKYNITALFGKTLGVFDAAKYVAKLSAAERDHLKEVSRLFSRRASRFLAGLGCSKQDLETIDNIGKSSFIAGPLGGPVCSFTGWVSLSKSLLENLN